MTDIRSQAWLDQEDVHTAEIIRRVGWLITYVGSCRCHDDGGPPFAYTVGLFGLHHPELLMLGVPQSVALGVLNNLGERIRDGERLTTGTIVTFEQWPHRIVPEEVPNPHEIVFAANRYYGFPPGLSVPVLQLSYDDCAGRFPWEPEYAAPHMQPRPGTFRA